MTITMYWGSIKIVKKESFKSKKHAIKFYNTRYQKLEREYNDISLTKIEED